MTRPLVVSGRATSHDQTWWVLVHSQTDPTLRVLRDNGEVQAATTLRTVHSFETGERAYVVSTTGLDPDTQYMLHVRDAGGNEALGLSRTLPQGLTPGSSFTIGLGSCYNWPMDLNEVHRYFPPVPHGLGGSDPMRLCYLLGDQIYMDLQKDIDAEKPSSWSRPLDERPDPWAAYLEQWTDDKYRFFLQAGVPLLFLADDHEVWNDFPHKPFWLTWTKGGEGDALARELQNSFDVFQASANLDPETVEGSTRITHRLIREQGLSPSFEVDPLSFFMLDTRMGRTRVDTSAAPHFTNPDHLEALLDWLSKSGGPGVLAVSQPIFEGKGGGLDHNYANYADDYARLINGLRTAKRRVIILAGDIHYSRLMTVRFGAAPDPENPTLVEFVASPFSRLKEGPGQPSPSGVEAREGVLKESAAHFRLEPKDTGKGPGNFFETTERQVYGTVTFTLSGDSSSIETVFRIWGPPVDTPNRARLLLERTVTIPKAGP